MDKEQILLRVTRVVNRCDPEGLLCAGAPLNEYEVEIKEIADEIAETKTGHSATAYAMILKNVFDKRFDRNYKIEYMQHIIAEFSKEFGIPA